MIALDTNILVYAHRKEAAHHAAAVKLVTALAEGDRTWGLPWPCVYEFLRVVTHPRVFDPPTTLETALQRIDALIDSPSVALLGQGPGHPAHMQRMVEAGRAVGNLVHDAHIAAIAIEHGVSELWTTDRDFARFAGLRTRDPFVEGTIHEPRARYRSRSTKRAPKRSTRK